MTEEVNNDDPSRITQEQCDSLNAQAPDDLEEIDEIVCSEITEIRDFVQNTPEQVISHIFDVLKQYPEVAKTVYLKLSCTFGGPAH
ncbi:hypothetical protein RsoM2USA_181 [Ralstonia phage RsoM2USA]|nr:hypothetical protein RsoM2USA_181 [Ralstonia phage RsoM2USA]